MPSRLAGLWCGGLCWYLLRLTLFLGSFQFISRHWRSGRLLFLTTVTKQREGGEAAIERQHHLASFDLANLPPVDVIANLRAQQFIVSANNGTRALAVDDNSEENQVWWRRWWRRRCNNLDGRRWRWWRRRRMACRRK